MLNDHDKASLPGNFSLFFVLFLFRELNFFFKKKKQCRTIGSQIGFIQFLCLPLYNKAVRIAPELAPCVSQLESNMDSWKKLKEEEEQAK